MTYSVVVTAPGRLASGRPVRWTAGHRLLVAKEEQITDAEASELASVIDAGGASSADLERYGRLLFEAAFGAATWRQLVMDAVASPYLEVAIRAWVGTGEADAEDAAQENAVASALQALRWEALHDGTTAVAARGAVVEASDRVPVGIVRLVPVAPHVIPSAPGVLPRLTRIPRVLFAIGSRLTDPRIRAGAEFMGILRHLERKGGVTQPRV